jgi:hypothetical protein
MGGEGWIINGDLCFGVFDGILCFRGSANVMNWIRDFSAIPVLHNGRLVHSGFVVAFAQLFDEVLPQVKQKNIVMTGHSLGAAIAVLFAEYLGCPAVTFGCPRVWVKGFSLPVKDHRYVICDDDPVPMVPRLFYQEFKNPIILAGQGGEIINPKDHNISVYIKRIERMA